MTFYSGVYGTCLGAMTQFGDNAKSLIGLSGIFIGVGEILGKIVHFVIRLHEIKWYSDTCKVFNGDCFFFFRWVCVWNAEPVQQVRKEPCGALGIVYTLFGLLPNIPEHSQ